MRLVFATNNEHKLAEISNLMGSGFDLVGLKDIGCYEEIPEDHPTLEENASDKAWHVFNKYGCDVFADDTGLEIDALMGEPGVFSARYAGEGKDPQDNMARVLNKMQGIKHRSAQFRTVISLVLRGAETQFEGIVKGTILDMKRGNAGFGYDPIFLPDGYDKTFAEMMLNEKNRASHRAMAIQKLVEYLCGIKN